MKQLKLILAGLFMCTCVSLSAQENNAPKGEPIIVIFSNFHTGFGSYNDDRGFGIDRSYLGYQYQLTDELQIKAVMDVGKSSDVGDYQHIAYIKNAMVSWKIGALTLNAGIIPLTATDFQEKYWGHRYIMKTFLTQYKFGDSADIGLSAAYKFNDWLSADVMVSNGEGFKKIQSNDGLLYGLGATITPAEGLTLRLYAGLNEGATAADDDIFNFSSLLGYKGDSFYLAAEYNIMQNTKYVKGADMDGFSVFGAVNLNKTAEIYARYDQIASKDDWNIAKDESAIIVGMQFKLNDYIKLAPNFRMNMPKADGADNKCMAYISCQFSL